MKLSFLLISIYCHNIRRPILTTPRNADVPKETERTAPDRDTQPKPKSKPITIPLPQD